MAEGWTRALKSDRIEPHSAGTHPHGLNPLAVWAMAEVGVDISRQLSKRPEDIGVPFDVVVTVCDSAHESCPIFPGARTGHAGFDDPPMLAKGAPSDDEAMPHDRRVRDEIRAFVQTLPESLSAQRNLDLTEKPMPTIKLFDPPMCCSSGVYGPDPDASLACFAADLQWLQGQGVLVQRFTLTQQPKKFTSEAAIMKAMNTGGAASLPIVMVDDQVVAERQYPSREQLASKLGLITAAASPSSKPGGCGCGPGKCC